MFKIENSLKKKMLVKKNTQPFDKNICNFFSDLSKTILENKNYLNYPDLLSFAFWVRKKNVENMYLKFKSNYIKKPLGLVFHITPNNVPINFAYSLFFGLITGNTNIIKVSSKNFDQIDIICELIKKLLNKKKYQFLNQMIYFLRYDKKYKEITKQISLNSNSRLIWGGDQTIKELRSIEVQPKNIDYVFPDRYSFSIINLDKLSRLNNENLNILINKFYTDVYTFDQNACNSPHLIIWFSQKKNYQIIEKFWKNFSIILKKKKINYPDTVVTEKYNKICSDVIKFSNIKSFKRYNKYLDVVTITELKGYNHLQRGSWGYFYQINSNNLNKLKNIITPKYQTLSYYGFDKKFFENFLSDNLQGIDRIVPIGRSLEMNYIWDGFNFFDCLTRTIDVK